MAYCRPITVLLLLLAAAQANAQQPQPQGAKEAAEPEPLSPAVQAILDTNPRTPAELVRAAKILADLGRPDLGKPYLAQVIQAGLTQEQLAGLVERFGSAIFSELVRHEEMLPEARQLADAVLAAANRALQDPKRLEQLIAQLRAPTPEERFAALAGLKQAHAAGVAALVHAMADPSRASGYPAIRSALAQMGGEALGPMFALVESDDPAMADQAIQVLALMDAKRSDVLMLRWCLSEGVDPKVRAIAAAALGRLSGGCPGRSEAVRVLVQRAKEYFGRGQPVEGLVDGQLEVFRWDVAKRELTSRRVPVDLASKVLAARLARDALRLAPEDHEVQVLAATTALEAAAFEHGLERPLPEGPGTPVAEVARLGIPVVEQVMQYAMDGGHVAAAAEAARILGRQGTAEGLLRRRESPAPLVQAAGHPDRRLRLAATAAVVRLQPEAPFAGASCIPESLGFFVATGGVRRALVAGPDREGLRASYGELSELGYEVHAAGNGRDVIRLATGSPDYELAMIDVSIEGPTAGLLVQQLRRDSRSADLRIGLVARDGFLGRARQIASRDPLCLAFSRPHSAEAVAWQVEQLAALAPRAFVSYAERQRQAAEALDRLADLCGADKTPYDLRRVEPAVLSASHVPALGVKAASVLGNLNSAESQQALVELASRWTQPLPVRQAAVSALRQSIEKHGILLTSAAIAQQYDRYNASADLDAASQRVLGMILDCLEAPTQAASVDTHRETPKPPSASGNRPG